MSLSLTIRNVGQLDNGSPLAMLLDRRGAVIGRAQTSDWCLPDPSLHISSRHCEIAYRDGSYVLTDVSTNGTYLNGSEARLPEPHVLRQGDVFAIGQFEIAVALDGMPAAQAPAPAPPGWQGWEAGAGSGPAAAPASNAQWDRPPPASAISGIGPMSQNWAPPQVDQGQPAAAGWGAASPPAAPPPSSWTPQAPALRARLGLVEPDPRASADAQRRRCLGQDRRQQRGRLGPGRIWRRRYRACHPAVRCRPPRLAAAAPTLGQPIGSSRRLQVRRLRRRRLQPLQHLARHPPRGRSTCTHSRPRLASRRAICSKIRTRPWHRPQPCCGGSLPGWS